MTGKEVSIQLTPSQVTAAALRLRQQTQAYESRASAVEADTVNSNYMLELPKDTQIKDTRS